MSTMTKVSRSLYLGTHVGLASLGSILQLQTHISNTPEMSLCHFWMRLYERPFPNPFGGPSVFGIFLRRLDKDIRSSRGCRPGVWANILSPVDGPAVVDSDPLERFVSAASSSGRPALRLPISVGAVTAQRP